MKLFHVTAPYSLPNINYVSFVSQHLWRGEKNYLPSTCLFMIHPNLETLHTWTKISDHENPRVLENHPKTSPWEEEIQFHNRWGLNLQGVKWKVDHVEEYNIFNGQSRTIGSPLVLCKVHLFLTGLTQYSIEHRALSTWYHIGHRVQFSSIQSSWVHHVPIFWVVFGDCFFTLFFFQVLCKVNLDHFRHLDQSLNLYHTSQGPSSSSVKWHLSDLGPPLTLN